MRKSLITACLVSATIAVTGTAFAGGHGSPADQAVAARQAHMTLYGFNIGPLGQMAQGKMDYDAAIASAAAANLAAMANMDQTAYWLEGSDASMGNNRAKAAIWEDADGFAAEIQKMAAAATALAAVAGDGLDALRGGIGAVGGSCGSCHERYRAPRQ